MANIERQREINWVKYLRYNMEHNSRGDTRSTLLTVATLIAAVTFQAAFQPPAGMLVVTPQPLPPPSDMPSPPQFMPPATVPALATMVSILGTHSTALMFVFANTLGISSSTSIIIYLTSGYPFQREFHMAMFAMMFAYGFVVMSIVKESSERTRTLVYVLLFVAFVLPLVVRWLPYWGKKA